MRRLGMWGHSAASARGCHEGQECCRAAPGRPSTGTFSQRLCFLFPLVSVLLRCQMCQVRVQSLFPRILCASGRPGALG